ncbi:MAG TPA: helix-turn-helix domain-containing protein [Paenibacillus sp.]
MHHTEQVQESVRYINQNLNAELSLEVLANHAHFSSYHFHRLFLQCTGEAPMKYVRRLRLREASRELCSMQLNIIEIAAKYKFESQDGFCRAFKSYYGLTPGEYRKLNVRMGSFLSDKQEVITMKYDMILYDKLACSHDDKLEALSTLDQLLELSDQARQSGLLSLEPEIEKVQPDIFKKSIQLLVDGIEPDSIKEILMNYAISGGWRGKDLLIRVLIIEGIVAIQQGTHTLILREKLASFFGDTFIGEVQKHFGLDRESQLKKIESFISKNQNKPVFIKGTSLLEEPIGRMDNRSLQRLLREIDAVTLGTAIVGASGKTQAKVLSNVSKKLAVDLIDEINTSTAVIPDIAAAQKHILETMHSLRNQGELVI